jgi:hypothetical protein
VATTLETGQQRDASNGPAPLQWIAVDGLIAGRSADFCRSTISRPRWPNQSACWRSVGEKAVVRTPHHGDGNA